MDPDSIPAVVTYITFDLDQIPSEITKSSNLKTYVLLNTQGEAVELIESPKTALTMFIFNIMLEVCPEVVFNTNSDKRYLIYNNDPNSVIHSDNINKSLSFNSSFYVIKNKKNEEQIINIKEIWDSIKSDNFEEKVSFAIQNIKSITLKTKKTTILGDVPTLLILITQYIISKNCDQIYYQKDLNSVPKRIK